MFEARTHLDLEPIVPKQSQEAIADPYTAWHATRGYDFAGIESMLSDGLLPSENQQDHAVCLSASPELAWASGREANSFYAYTLQDGISLAIRQDYPQYPTGNHGGFFDEIRKPRVEAADIYGLMLPEEALSVPLDSVATSHEPRKPLKAKQHIERTVQHITDLGGQVDEEATKLLTRALEVAGTGSTLDREVSAQVETILMRAYAETLTTKFGIANPTVGDMLTVVFDRVSKKPDVLIYTDDQKREIGTANAKIAVKNQARSVGGFSMNSAFREW